MSGIHGRFSRLQWRLIATYVVVTLVAALTLEFTLSAAQFAQEHAAPPPPLAQSLEDLAGPVVAPYLAQHPADSATLTQWAHFLIQTPGSNGQPKNQVWEITRLDMHLPGAVAAVAICDRAGQVLATANNGSDAPALLTTLPSQARITAAFSGDQHPADLTWTAAHGRTVVAVPILTLTKTVLGVLAIVVVPGAVTPNLLTAFLTSLLPDAVVLMVLAIVVGTFFGVLISRGITRRLRHLTQATHAWSQGEFHVVVRDHANDELGELAHDLNRMADHLQQLLTARQDVAVIEERQRLARDLHDSVKQQVFATALLLEAARRLLPTDLLPVQAYLTEAHDLVNQTRQELTALIHALRPAALDGRGLVAVMQDYAQHWSQRTHIVVDVRVGQERATPVAIENTLFRVLQEALANVSQHSGARQVIVRLTWDDASVQLTIQDDGSGFTETATTGRGMGLTNMRERVQAHAGSMQITSTTVGTTVLAQVPLAQALVPQEARA